MEPNFEHEYAFAVFGEIYTAESAVGLVNKYHQVRDESGMGQREWPNAAMYRNGKVIGWFSYNGRVWFSKQWDPEAKPLDVNSL